MELEEQKMQETTNTSIGFGIASLVFGIVSIISLLFIIISVITAILAIVFGFIAMKKDDKLGKAGLILGILSIIVTFLLFLFLGVFDVSFLRIVPNITIMAPVCEKDFRDMVNKTIEYKGPTVIRYNKSAVRELSDNLVSENFDIVITDNGMIKVDDGTSAVRDRLLFEISSNNSWIFDSGLGINWVDEYGTGLLQTKNAEPAIVNALEKKLNNITKR